MSMVARRKVRIRLYGTSYSDLESVAREIVDIAKKMGVGVRGPVPLPTKRLMVTTRKAPSGEGYHTFEHWELRIHKRLIDIEANDKVIRRLMTIKVPDTVKIELQLV
ncbi:30S ribosomal protein S10 [Thermoproteus sp. CP80]|jgi:SSU ribosomal protein S10P|uniref:30S ribosomal protein S10 n=1 Tax=Thermoproteus sp. CP80 TaxID=1650659 RepID=UPI00074A57C4|nr:30S ribosomal protein S10 [Thermoproteus sp. CP80]KUO85326.1 MAG: 30S ribosomal protein S10 [Thermoproteus sp. CIS_19]PLC65936.1 30S ribosomal protein S10 [Thermoproteus sp. CP80]